MSKERGPHNILLNTSNEVDGKSSTRLNDKKHLDEKEPSSTSSRDPSTAHCVAGTQTWKLHPEFAGSDDDELANALESYLNTIGISACLFSGIISAWIIVFPKDRSGNLSIPLSAFVTVDGAKFYFSSFEPLRNSALAWTGILLSISLLLSLSSVIGAISAKVWISRHRNLPFLVGDVQSLRSHPVRWAGVTFCHLGTVINSLPIILHVSFTLAFGALLLFMGLAQVHILLPSMFLGFLAFYGVMVLLLRHHGNFPFRTPSTVINSFFLGGTHDSIVHSLGNGPRGFLTCAFTWTDALSSSTRREAVDRLRAAAQRKMALILDGITYSFARVPVKCAPNHTTEVELPETVVPSLVYRIQAYFSAVPRLIPAKVTGDSFIHFPNALHSELGAKTMIIRDTAITVRSPGAINGNAKVPNLTGYIHIITGPLYPGGFSDIYSGQFKSARGTEKVAMKMLRIFSSEVHMVKTKKKFCREVDLWCSLKHPHVLPFYGTCEIDEFRLFMVSPWAGGGNSLEYLRRHPFADRKKLLLQTASALEYLHSGTHAPPIVHGDLKADNVLVSAAGDALLADFGLSVHVEEILSISGSSSAGCAGGNARFMAPELLLSPQEGSGISRPTRESDVFSFASLMLQIYTEKVPFVELRREVQAIMAIATGTLPSRPTDPVVLERGCNDRIWTLMSECWRFRPSERPNMEEIRRRLLARGGAVL